MRRMIGFILFWMAIGMILMFIFPRTLMRLGLISLFLVLGYNLYWC